MSIGARVTLLLGLCTLAMAGDMIPPALFAAGVAVAPYIAKGLSSLFGGGSGGAEKAKLAAMHDAANQYAETAPRYIEARQNSLANLAGLFSPVNSALGQMYGSGAQFDMSKFANPVLEPRYYEPPPAAGPSQMPTPLQDPSANNGAFFNGYHTGPMPQNQSDPRAAPSQFASYSKANERR